METFSNEIVEVTLRAKNKKKFLGGEEAGRNLHLSSSPNVKKGIDLYSGEIM